MRKLLVLFICCLLVQGCTVHKFQKSEKLGGYAVARFGYVIPEYTVDLDNKAPGEFTVAKARYLRRNDMVETYYIRMGQIESYGRRYITHFPRIMGSMAINTFKMPFHIVSEYRYDHNESYRKKIDELDAKQKAREDERIALLRRELGEFIRQDMEKEAKLLDVPGK